MTELNPQPAPLEADEAKVKRERVSLTRGPVATMLLFLIGTIALVLVGFFWTYPTYAEMTTIEEEVLVLDADLVDTQAKLDEAKSRTENREMTPEEERLAQGIAPDADPARIIRDILELAALDETNPDDDLSINNFSIDKPTMTGTFATIPVNLSFSAPLSSVDILLGLLGDASKERRLGSVLTISLGIANVTPPSDTASPNAVQLAFLLREAQRHRITAQGRRDLQALVQRRVEEYAAAKERVAVAQSDVRRAEGRAATASGADLLTAQRELATLRSTLKREEDALTKLERDLDAVRKESTVTLKIVLYAESDALKEDVEKPAVPVPTPAP